MLLCENQEGYRNLINLVSTAYLEGFYYKPRIDKDLLAQHSEGLIAMSACLRGDINETLLADTLRRRAAGWRTPTRTSSAKTTFSSRFRTIGLEQDKRVTPQVNRLSLGNRHPAGRHQRFALPAPATTPAPTKS